MKTFKQYLKLVKKLPKQYWDGDTESETKKPLKESEIDLEKLLKDTEPKPKDYLKENNEFHLGTSDHTYKGYSDAGETLNDVKNHLHSHKATLTPEEFKSLSTYAKDTNNANSPQTAYQSINNYHRGIGVNHDSLQRMVKEHTKNLDSALSITQHHLHSWRGLVGMSENHGVPSEFSKLKPGDTFHDKGYVSTTAYPQTARGFGSQYSERGLEGVHMAHIKIPKGSKAIALNTYKAGHYHEHEVLLPRNSKFHYDSKEELLNAHGMKTTIHHLTHIPESEHEEI